MSRQDTIMTDKWRVQVIRPDGTVSCESMFKDEVSAYNYFTSLDIPGSTVRIQVRLAGKSRFSTLQSEVMTCRICGQSNPHSD